ncbi:hypothetical protein NWQ33_06150 [Mycoplasmopsis cynos]|nr:hypothetical protein [Mycoplasmopsis cynos]
MTLFKSKEFYEIQSGAKGVSKSFGGAIISIYRLVNEKYFVAYDVVINTTISLIHCGICF